MFFLDGIVLTKSSVFHSRENSKNIYRDAHNNDYQGDRRLLFSSNPAEAAGVELVFPFFPCQGHLCLENKLGYKYV